jgi:hypothetical protein
MTFWEGSDLEADGGSHDDLLVASFYAFTIISLCPLRRATQ